MRETGRRAVRATVCAALLGWAGAAAADDITTTISGYGTLGGTFTQGDSLVAFHHDPTEFTGATNQFDLGLDSRLGLQALVDFGSGFSVTAQELVRQRGSDEFSLGTEWLYAQYAPNSDWKIRLGRVVLAAFLLSDSRNVGYAAPWFRAPNELYGTQQIQSLDGGQVVWTHTLGPIELGLQGSFGTATTSNLVKGTAESFPVKNLYNVSASVQWQSLLVRVAQTSLNIPTELPLGPTVYPFELHDNFTSVGAQYDDGKAIVMAEWARRSDNEAPVLGIPVNQTKQWYTAGGWRFGKLTPLVMYGNYKTFASLANTPASYGTWSTSLRYDVVRNIALKAQYSRPQAANGTYWVTPQRDSTQRVNVMSLGADFVF
jgi:hypothetical protein